MPVNMKILVHSGLSIFQFVRCCIFGFMLHVIFHSGKSFMFFIQHCFINTLDGRRGDSLINSALCDKLLSKLMWVRKFSNAKSNLLSFPSEHYHQFLFPCKICARYFAHCICIFKRTFPPNITENKLLVVVLTFKMITNTKIIFLLIAGGLIRI